MVMPSRDVLGLGTLNPKLGLGFMIPIWVEKGPRESHPNNASIRRRTSIRANDEEVGVGLKDSNP